MHLKYRKMLLLCGVFIQNNVIFDFDFKCTCDQSRFVRDMRNYELSWELLFCLCRNAISILKCEAQLIDESRALF